MPVRVRICVPAYLHYRHYPSRHPADRSFVGRASSSHVARGGIGTGVIRWENTHKTDRTRRDKARRADVELRGVGGAGGALRNASRACQWGSACVGTGTGTRDARPPSEPFQRHACTNACIVHVSICPSVCPSICLACIGRFGSPALVWWGRAAGTSCSRMKPAARHATDARRGERRRKRKRG